MTEKTINTLVISQIKGIGPSFVKNKRKEFIKYHTSIDEFLKVVKKEEDIISLPEYNNKANQVIEYCENNNIKIASIFDIDYPVFLREIKNPPPIIYYRGNIELTNNCVSIIGTRKSSEIGNKIAEKVGNFFKSDWSICNGLADGIDEKSISYKDYFASNVVGILGGGVDFENSTVSKNTQKLSEKVLSNNGLLISEKMPSQKEDRFSLINACKIQAGLSVGLILIQSSIKGGSRFTVKAFSELERPLGIIEFKQHQEYSTEIFSGNRLILEKKEKGIAEFSEVKQLKNIKTNQIISISSKSDYELFSDKLNDKKKWLTLHLTSAGWV